jgi:hypothetical protein
MKLIESNNETITLEIQRDELRDLHNALSDAIESLDRQSEILGDLIMNCEGIDDPGEITALIGDSGRAEETVAQLEKILEQAKRLLPKVYDLSDGLRRIISQKGL